MKNILNEELNRMKYLFGHQRGVVISEQQADDPKKNIKQRVIDAGGNWEQVKREFGSSGSLKDNMNIINAMNDGWRPGQPVPEKYLIKKQGSATTSDNKTATDYFTATGVSVQGAFDQIAEGKEKMNNETFNTFAYFIKSAPRVENGLVVGKVDGVGSKLNPEEFKTKYKNFETYTFVPTPQGGFKSGMNVEQKSNTATNQEKQGAQETQNYEGIYGQFAQGCKNYVSFNLGNEVRTINNETYVRTADVKVVNSGVADNIVGCKTPDDLQRNIAYFALVGAPNAEGKSSVRDQTEELENSVYIKDNGLIQKAIEASKSTSDQGISPGLPKSDQPEKTAAQVEQEGQSQWCKDNTVAEFDEKCFSINVKPGETVTKAEDNLSRIARQQGFVYKRDQNFDQAEGTLEQVRGPKGLSKEERKTREERKPKTNVGETGQSMYAFNKDTESMIEVNKKLEGFGPNEQSYLRDLLKNTKGGKLGVGEGNNYERAERRALRDAKDQLGGAEPKVAGEKKYAYNPDTRKYKYGVVATA